MDASDHQHLDCGSLMSQVWDYLDGELSPDRVAAVEAHLAMCTNCTGHVAFERTVRDAIRHARDAGPDTDRLATRVRDALAAAGYRNPRE